MYSVGINGTWNKNGKATKEFFESNGCIVNPSRLNGDFDVFFDGKMISTIFNDKKDQIKFLISKGLI